MRFLLCLTTAIGLAATAAPANSAIYLNLNTGAGVLTTRECRDGICTYTPEPTAATTALFKFDDNFQPLGGNVNDSFTYSVTGATAYFTGPMTNGYWSPSFSLTFDHDLGGVFPMSNAGFVSGAYDAVNTINSKTFLPGFTVVYPVVSFTVGHTPPAVPEPATWAMMIFGFAAVGAAMRHRNHRLRLILS